MQVDAGAGRNKRMFDEVKKGDRVLIPHLPRYGHITVGEATEDWNWVTTFPYGRSQATTATYFRLDALRNFRRGNWTTKAL
jgi:hypothetical protein